MRFLLILFVITWSFGSIAGTTDRPPQFVMLAFDNCEEIGTWSQVSDVIDSVDSINKDTVHFTFFVSAVGLLTDKARMAYVDPMGHHGRANIDFGGTEEDVLQRIAWLNKIRAEGNEIGSHAVGHFSGKNWSVAQWRHEFEQYDYILTHLAEINHLNAEQATRAQLSFTPKDLAGFRAPYLDGGAKVNQVLAERHFAYDTSDSNQGWEPNTWPKKYKDSPSIWNFGLTFITSPLSVTGKAGQPRRALPTKVIAMDYNFCFEQTGGCPDKDPYANQADADAEQVLSGYLSQFVADYNGNRAPLNIGHHFQPYRGGAYDRILFRFAKTVCQLPEVRCATYSELANFLGSAPPQALEDYQSSRFPPPTKLDLATLLKAAGVR